MRAVVQRVSQAGVSVSGEAAGEIGAGLLVLVGVAPGDAASDIQAMAEKLVHLRLMPDSDGKMNRSVLETGGEILVVSQFTLQADIRKGRRPSFTAAAPPDIAEAIIERLTQHIADLGVPVAAGVFGAHMEVTLVNDGPVTVVIDVADGKAN